MAPFYGHQGRKQGEDQQKAAGRGEGAGPFQAAFPQQMWLPALASSRIQEQVPLRAHGQHQRRPPPDGRAVRGKSMVSSASKLLIRLWSLKLPFLLPQRRGVMSSRLRRWRGRAPLCRSICMLGGEGEREGTALCLCTFLSFWNAPPSLLPAPEAASPSMSPQPSPLNSTLSSSL